MTESAQWANSVNMVDLMVTITYEVCISVSVAKLADIGFATNSSLITMSSVTRCDIPLSGCYCWRPNKASPVPKEAQKTPTWSSMKPW